jgi:predicted Zn-dependent peptidase
MDPAESTGLAHYLEHVLFKGTDNLGTLDYAKEKPYLDEVEAPLSSSTSPRPMRPSARSSTNKINEATLKAAASLPCRTSSTESTSPSGAR